MKGRIFYRELNRVESLSDMGSIPEQSEQEKDEMEALARRCTRREIKKGWKHEMNRIQKFSITIAACTAFVVIGSQTAMAKEFFREIARVSTGIGYVAQDEAPDAREIKAIAGAMFEKIKGNVYDADGNMIESFDDLKEGMTLYTKGGEEIDSIEPDGTITTKQETEDSFKTYETWEEALPYIDLDLMLPDMPEGYELESIRLYPESESGKSIYVYSWYSNSKGKEIIFETRNLLKDGGYTVGTEEKVTAAEVNGVPAAIIGNQEIIWEQDNQQLSIRFRDEKPGKDALVKMAESLKAIQ